MEKPKEKKIEKVEEVKVDPALMKDIAKQVSAELAPGITEIVKSTVKEAMVEATEKTVKKNIKPKAKNGEQEIENGDKPKKLGKELRLVKAMIALKRGDYQAVKAYNIAAQNERVEKSGYGNTATDADGGYLVPDAEFEAEVERLEEEYGVAFQYASVKRIDKTSVKLNKKDTGFELVETNEAGAKPSVSFTIGQVTADLRKFTGIQIATDELEEDSAIDYWGEIATEFAYARSKKSDELVFTDATSGLLEISDTKAQTVGAAVTDLDWDDLMNAEIRVPTPSQKAGRWFMHRTAWNQLAQTKAAADGHYFFSPNPNAPTTPWGTPVTLTEVLPATGEVGANDGFAVFGDLKHMKVYVKNGLQLTMLTEATLDDADDVEINLATQDAKAMRGVVRMLAVAKFPDAFCILGTGTVS